MDADVLENVAQVAQLLAAGCSGLRLEIKNLAILHSVVGETSDAAVLVEIDRDHTLIDNFMWHESGRPLSLLRDVIKGFAVDGGNCGRRAEHDQYLFLCSSDGNLFQSAFRQYVSPLQCFGDATGGQRQRARKSQRQPECSLATAHVF